MTALITGFTPNQWDLIGWVMGSVAAAITVFDLIERARDRRIQKVRAEMRRDMEAHFADALNLARNDNPLDLCRTPEDFVFAGAVLADIDDLGGVA